VKIDKIITSIKEFFITIGWLTIPIFQYIPCASVWFGIMSLPLIGYLFFFISTPMIAKSDFEFFLGYGFPWSIIAIISGFIFLFCLVYQLVNRKKLILKGPYRYSRHPQYLAIIIMTFSLSMISLNTSPINPFSSNIEFSRVLIFFICFIETIAYILLAKLEEFWLEKKYGDMYNQYKQSVSFMLPFTKFFREKLKIVFTI
jgi:protein-S-isoprenylcysteine O-methyltransferase Ste14